MKRLIIGNLFLIVGICLGGMAGFLYWKYVGCLSSACPIKSVWYNSVVYGAVMGGLLGSMFEVEKPKEKMEE
ncbi:MAG TPA: DUF6132 family protein [Cytophagaceae bacterium]